MVAVQLLGTTATQAVRGLLDTGAEESLIHRSLLPDDAEKIKVGTTRIIVANGSEMPNIGQFTVKVGLGGLQFTHSFFVIPVEVTAKILGVDFVSAQKVSLTFNPLAFKVEGKDVPVVLCRDKYFSHGNARHIRGETGSSRS
ncbi:uncharacterized protein LOC143019442 [Oratosquilla oratoria]|uniref:uncharacterized protein LOC143019442 n=1 Tax=Oratosquilla oratoria TaxID=337810 RepID=UPI003F75F9F8